MNKLRTVASTALAIVFAASATQANAQALRGFRIEAQTGLDRFYSEGNHHNKLGVGGAAGSRCGKLSTGRIRRRRAADID